MTEERPEFDITGWLTPEEVLVRASVKHRHAERQAIWTRLVSGMITAAASRVAHKQGRYGEWEQAIKPWLIATKFWSKYEDRPDHCLWRGEAEFALSSGSDYRTGRERYVHCYDILFKPEDVDREFPAPPGTTDKETVVQRTDILPVLKEIRRPVTAPHLKAWYQVFKAAYTGTPQDTLAHALASAQGMFPDKIVSRDAVRAVIREDTGPRKRGPKAKS